MQTGKRGPDVEIGPGRAVILRAIIPESVAEMEVKVSQRLADCDAAATGPKHITGPVVSDRLEVKMLFSPKTKHAPADLHPIGSLQFPRQAVQFPNGLAGYSFLLHCFNSPLHVLRSPAGGGGWLLKLDDVERVAI